VAQVRMWDDACTAALGLLERGVAAETLPIAITGVFGDMVWVSFPVLVAFSPVLRLSLTRGFN